MRLIEKDDWLMLAWIMKIWQHKELYNIGRIQNIPVNAKEVYMLTNRDIICYKSLFSLDETAWSINQRNYSFSAGWALTLWGMTAVNECPDNVTEDEMNEKTDWCVL